MKKLGLLFALFAVSSPVFAWEFTELSIMDRSFEMKNEHGGVYTVADIRCTATDGRDSLYVAGYFSPTGRWNYIGRQISGRNIRAQLKRIDDSLLPAYMNFCARVNRN